MHTLTGNDAATLILGVRQHPKRPPRLLVAAGTPADSAAGLLLVDCVDDEPVHERDGKMDDHLCLLWRRVAGWLLAAVPPFLAVPEQADHGEKEGAMSPLSSLSRQRWPSISPSRSCTGSSPAQSNKKWPAALAAGVPAATSGRTGRFGRPRMLKTVSAHGYGSVFPQVDGGYRPQRLDPCQVPT
jgi:hypothetical protein